MPTSTRAVQAVFAEICGEFATAPWADVGIGPYKRERNQIMEFPPKKEKDKHLGLRIDRELHYKLHYISQYDGRSANGEVIYLIRQRIEQFEQEHGKIDLPD